MWRSELTYTYNDDFWAIHGVQMAGETVESTDDWTELISEVAEAEGKGEATKDDEDADERVTRAIALSGLPPALCGECTIGMRAGAHDAHAHAQQWGEPMVCDGKCGLEMRDGELKWTCETCDIDVCWQCWQRAATDLALLSRRKSAADADSENCCQQTSRRWGTVRSASGSRSCRV